MNGSNEKKEHTFEECLCDYDKFGFLLGIGVGLIAYSIAVIMDSGSASDYSWAGLILGAGSFGLGYVLNKKRSENV